MNLILVTGVLQLCTGVLSLITFLILFIYGIYPQDLTVLYYEITCGALGLINILLGLESLFLNSSDNRVIRNALTFGLISSLTLSILMITTSRNFAAVYLGSTIMDSETDLWGNVMILLYNISYYLGTIIAFVGFIIICLLSISLYKNLNPE